MQEQVDTQHDELNIDASYDEDEDEKEQNYLALTGKKSNYEIK